MMHNPHEQNQNLGNRLGQRPCVGQNEFSRQQDSGNAMKGILGHEDLTWNTNARQGAFEGGGLRPVGAQSAVSELTAKVGGGRQNGFFDATRKSKMAEVSGKITGAENNNPIYGGGENFAAGADLRQQQAPPQKNTRSGAAPPPRGGNPLSWDESDQWQTTSSQNGAFYRR